MESYYPEHTKDWSCCNGTKKKQNGCHHASTRTSFGDIGLASQDHREKVSKASANSTDSSIGEELHSSRHSVIDTETYTHMHTQLTRSDSESEVIQTNDSPKQNVCRMPTSTPEVQENTRLSKDTEAGAGVNSCSNGLEDSGMITDEIDDNKGNEESRQKLAANPEIEKNNKLQLPRRQQLKLYQSIKIPSCSSLAVGCTQLVSGTNEGLVWYIAPDCSEIKSCTKVAGPVVSLSTWNDYVAVGSAVVQVLKTSDEQPTRVMYRKAKDRLMVPGRKHLVSFIGDSGKIVTTEVSGKSINIWPPPAAADTKVVMKSEMNIPINGNVLSLCASRESENPLIAVLLEKDTKLELKVIDVNNNYNQYSQLLEGDIYSTDVFAEFYPNTMKKIVVGVRKHLQVYTVTTAVGLCLTSSKEFDTVISCVNALDNKLLGVGFNNGHFICVDCSLNSTHYNCDMNDLQLSNSPVVSLALLGNKDVCVAHNDGVLQLWKVDHNLNCGTKLRQRSTLGMELHNQGMFSMPEIVHSITGEQEIGPGAYLTLPQEVIESKNVQVETAFRPCGLGHATFVLPELMVPISQAVWLCTTPERQFKEPATLKLFHCYQNDAEEHKKRITFLKADHKDITRRKNGDIVIEFKARDEGQSDFPINTPYGTIQDYHFCIYCLAVYCEEWEVLEGRNYRLSILKPTTYQTSKTAKIYCILSFDLPECNKLIGEQFARIKAGAVDYSPVIAKPLRFDTPRDQSALEMHIDYTKAQRLGWRMHVESDRKIYAEDVNFFNYRNTEQLEKACTTSEMDQPYPYTYPPRFIIEVSPENAQGQSDMTVTFTGARQAIPIEIGLSLDIPRGVGDGGRLLNGMVDPRNN